MKATISLSSFRQQRRAALWLRLKGYSILAMRVKLPGGEIDLIARYAERMMVAGDHA